MVTNDYNLNKIAQLQGVDVINLNDLANALKPIVLPGEGLTVKLIKRGEEPGQGVGYLDDGTMVVTEQGGAPPRRDRPADRHERPADQRRADDLRPDRPRRPVPSPDQLLGAGEPRPRLNRAIGPCPFGPALDPGLNPPTGASRSARLLVAGQAVVGRLAPVADEDEPHPGQVTAASGRESA